MVKRSLRMSVGARAVRALTARRSAAGLYPAYSESTSFLGPEPTGFEAAHVHVREKRKLSRRLREFFVYSPALGRTVGVRVLLPGIPQEHAVPLFLFHGGGDDFRSWTDLGRAELHTRGSRFLVVMPDAGAAVYSRHELAPGEVEDWPEFHVRELPMLIGDLYSTCPELRVAAGLSMGGYGAMKYAAWRPDLYAAAAAFSSPLIPQAAPPLFEILALRAGAPADSLFGSFKDGDARWEANSPYDLAENLRGLDIWLSAGSGTPDDAENSSESADVMEAHLHNHGGRFAERLGELGIKHAWAPRETGMHNWFAWQRELKAWLAHATQADLDRSPTGTPSRDPRPRFWTSVADGAPFTFISGLPVFEIYGWKVEISRRRPQIVTFGDVSPSGFTLNGAGTFRVTSPPMFMPGAEASITVRSPLGVNPYTTRADASGAISITGQMGAALHDPIVPGNRTKHFRTWGQAAVTEVIIRGQRKDSDKSATMERSRKPKKLPKGGG
ncbi:Diacylglycerol acyltransferase/mycolyltransferase Ag85B precursor [Brevibacterium ravenspurgense]|uniref:Diacylglycerol acyltransferase/mycolyltransferase Ag85B n=1 Tax=Brevibacterium ravenspurgense TaxID=479117 RepID=A0A150H9N2_9MICO|nr:alpha/beta hydrolase-fold protein [Brevibacterium ravenspurgense]KXZ58548.1 Diacylglycerol acyltransferase/mycolyltransferase Ag85B precursor [Brevibacterium ravenspurgense]